MKNKKKMNEYSVFHFLLGIFSFDKPIIIPVFLSYQFYQLKENKRYFYLEGVWKEGNSLLHTEKKIAEFLFGYLLVYFSK